MVARTLTAAQIAALRLPTRTEVHNVVSALPQLSDRRVRGGGGEFTDSRGNAIWSESFTGVALDRHRSTPGIFLEVGPGLLRVFRTKAHLQAAAEQRGLESAHRSMERRLRQERAVYRSAMAMLTDDDLAVIDPRRRARVNTSTGKITGWSRRSRTRMNAQLRRIDFAPLYEDGLEPAMVTLTMPGKDDDGRDTWADFAPTPGEFKKIVNRFTAAYRFAWGAPIRAVWKMEFQHRGAPHLHILMTPPAGNAEGQYPYEFQRWLAEAWARAVGSEGSVRARHIDKHLHSTTISYVGEQYRDPQRIATYFGKHGTFGAKEYQNEMPPLWRDAIAHGEDGARFWGVWGLKKASAVLQLDDSGSAAVEVLIDPLGVSRMWQNITRHYRRNDDGTWVLVEERPDYAHRIIDEEEQPWATDASVLRQLQRTVVGSSSSDAVKVQRYMRKASKARAMRGQQLVRNEHGQLVLPRDSRAIRRIRFEAPHPSTGEIRTVRRYRIGYYNGGSGMLLVNDGVKAARDLQRLLDHRAAWELAG
jgi:hypothetical protein